MVPPSLSMWVLDRGEEFLEIPQSFTPFFTSLFLKARVSEGGGCRCVGFAPFQDLKRRLAGSFRIRPVEAVMGGFEALAKELRYNIGRGEDNWDQVQRVGSAGVGAPEHISGSLIPLSSPFLGPSPVPLGQSPPPDPGLLRLGQQPAVDSQRGW